MCVCVCVYMFVCRTSSRNWAWNRQASGNLHGKFIDDNGNGSYWRYELNRPYIFPNLDMCKRTSHSPYTLKVFSSIFKKPFLAGGKHQLSNRPTLFLHVTSDIDDYFYISIAFMLYFDLIGMLSTYFWNKLFKYPLSILSFFTCWHIDIACNHTNIE